MFSKLASVKEACKPYAPDLESISFWLMFIGLPTFPYVIAFHQPVLWLVWAIVLAVLVLANRLFRALSLANAWDAGAITTDRRLAAQLQEVIDQHDQ